MTAHNNHLRSILESKRQWTFQVLSTINLFFYQKNGMIEISFGVEP